MKQRMGNYKAIQVVCPSFLWSLMNVLPETYIFFFLGGGVLFVC